MTHAILTLVNARCQTAAVNSTRLPYDVSIDSSGGRAMEFSGLFLGVLIAMLAAWCGSRTVALLLFGLVFMASAATLLHHATDALKLSF